MLFRSYKYMAFQLFAIPIDEDPDKETHTLAKVEKFAEAKELTMTEEDIKILKDMVEQAGVQEDTILNAMKVLTWEEIPRSKFAGIAKKLQTKISEKG